MQTPWAAFSAYRSGRLAKQIEKVLAETAIQVGSGRFNRSERKPSTLTASDYLKMGRDPEVRADMAIRRALMIPGLQLQPRDSDEGAKKAAHLIEEIERQMPGSSLTMYRDRMLGEALDYGFMVGQPEFVTISIPEFGPVRGLKRIVVPEATDFEGNIEQDDFGNIIKLTQKHGISTVELTLDEVLWYAYRGSDNNPEGVSCLYPAYDPWRLKIHVLGLLAVFTTVNASGLKKLKIPAALYEKEKNNALELLKALSEHASIPIPDNWDLSLDQPPGTAGFHFIRIIQEVCNKEIRKAILYDETVNAEGMHSWGQAGKEEARNSVEEIMAAEGAEFCEAVITEQLYRRILDENGYFNLPVPLCLPEGSAKRDASAIAVLTGLGDAKQKGVITVDIPEDLQNQLIEKAVHPTGVNYDLVSQDENTSKAPADTITLERFAGAPRGRTRADVLKLKKAHDEADAKGTKALVDVWGEVWPGVSKAVDAALFDKDGHWRSKNFGVVRKAIEGSVTKGGSQIRDTLQKTLLGRYEQGWDDGSALVKLASGVGTGPMVYPGAAKDALAQRVYLILENQYGEMTSDLYNQIEAVLLGTTSEREAMVLVRSYLQNAALPVGRASTIMSTALAQAYNSGRMALYDTLRDPLGETPGGIIGYQVSNVLDGHTTEICQLYGGLFVRVDDPNLVRPPFHYGCRTLLLPVFTGEPLWGSTPEWASLARTAELRSMISVGFGGLMPTRKAS